MGYGFGLGYLTTRDVLQGRPFGGVLSLVKKSLSMQIKHILSKERLVILDINNTLFINVYLPCNDNSLNYREILLEILTDISDAIDRIDYTGLVFGGDFNCKLVSNSDQSKIVKDFLEAYDMKFIDLSKYNAGDVYTFSNKVKGSYSIIDYICVSDCYLNCLTDYSVVHSAMNFSDHEGVAIVLNFSIATKDCLDCNASVYAGHSSVNQPIDGRFKFDHCNTEIYYEYTRQLLEP